jgi:probable rRNA maturation factor
VAGSKGRARGPRVQLADLQRRRVDRRAVRGVAAHVLRAEGRADAALSVTLVDDEAMAELHLRYSKVAGPTDVLAFPLDDELLLGEVVVSTDTAAREAKERGLTLLRETLLYVAHGTLHLLGYDDHRAADRRRMHARQSELLESFLSARATRRARRARSRAQKNSETGTVKHATRQHGNSKKS